MKLWATLPSLHDPSLVSKVLESDEISAVRLNTGVHSPLSPRESLQFILRAASVASSEDLPIWVDLDGRQLRVKNWSYPMHGGKVCLNRNVNFGKSAMINFRGDNRWYNLEGSRGKTVSFNPLPKKSLGCGQTANINDASLEIKGPYLTGLDKQYITEALRLGVNRFMLSFFEGQSDVEEVVKAACDKEIELILKIENSRGFLAAQRLPKSDNIRFMAARDDWYINSQNEASFLYDVKGLIELDKRAIAASRIFSGLENGGKVTVADWSDLVLLDKFGYKTFMLSDGICQYYFEEAIEAWRNFLKLDSLLSGEFY